jgi:glutathione S-transferase
METVRNGTPGLKGRAIAGPHDYDQIRGVVERGKLRVRDFYADLDAHLADVPFVASEQFSAADITALVTVDLRQRQSASQYPRTTKPRGAGTSPFLRVLALLPNSRCAGRRELGAACRRQAQLDECRG